jgi:hypothetical protein
MCFEWCKLFSKRRAEAEFDSQPGHPTTSKSDEYAENVRIPMRNDLTSYVTIIAEELNINTETVQLILMEKLAMILHHGNKQILGREKLIWSWNTLLIYQTSICVTSSCFLP